MACNGSNLSTSFSTSCRFGLGPIGGDKTRRCCIENGSWPDLRLEAFCKRGASLWKLSGVPVRAVRRAGFAPENGAQTRGFGAWRWATGHRRPKPNSVLRWKQNKSRAQQERWEARRQKTTKETRSDQYRGGRAAQQFEIRPRNVKRLKRRCLQGLMLRGAAVTSLSDGGLPHRGGQV